jgi:hypothetical protein
MWEATDALNRAGRLGKRAADRTAADVTSEHRAAEDTARRRGGGLPTGAAGIQPWAEAVSGKQADTDSRVTDTRRNAEQTHREQHHLAEQHLRESAALHQHSRCSAPRPRVRPGRARRASRPARPVPIVEPPRQDGTGARRLPAFRASRRSAGQ